MNAKYNFLSLRYREEQELLNLKAHSALFSTDLRDYFQDQVYLHILLFTGYIKITISCYVQLLTETFLMDFPVKIFLWLGIGDMIDQ